MKQQNCTQPQKRVQQRLIQLVWLAVQDLATKNQNDSYKEYAGATLAALMNVERSTWSGCIRSIGGK